MKELATTAFRSDESTNDIDPWAVIVRPPKELDNPREAAERLFDGLHGHGTISFEAHSDGENVELHLVAEDEPTARTVARHVRAELDAEAEIVPASLPVDKDDTLAAATFGFERDAIFPPATDRTDEKDIGPLHHILDTLGEEDIKGVYQVTAEPVGDWATRRSRDLPEPLADEKDIETEVTRAGVVLVPLIGLSAVLSPWPLETSFVLSLGLMTAATVGEGVSLPKVRTADEIAATTKEQAKERHGARSEKGKRAKKAAGAISEQGDAQGWRLAVRLVVSGENGSDSVNHRDRLANQVEKAFASKTTGQKLVTNTEDDARDVLDDVRERRPNQPTPREHLHQLLGHSTRKTMHGGTFVLSSLGYFPDEKGGGEGAREFSTGTGKSLSVPDTAPRPSQNIDQDADVPLFDDLSWHIQPEETVTKRHPEYGEIELLQIEPVPGDEDDIATVSEFVHKLMSEDDDFMLFGSVERSGSIRFLGIPSSDLTENMLVVGAPGTGKSTFAVDEAVQHAHAGRGFMAIDPHEQMVNDIQQRIPEHRQDDVIRIDPADIHSAWTHVVNMLEIDTEPGDEGYQEDVDGAVGDVSGMLYQGSSNIGDRMKSIVKGIVRGAIKSSKTYTFVDLRRILREESEQEKFREQMVEDGFYHLAEFVEDLMEMEDKAAFPVIRLLDDWIQSETARELVKHTENTLNWDELVRGNPILLINTDIYNDEIQTMFSTYFVKWADRACRRRPEGEQTTFPIIIDEVDDILSEEMDLGETLVNGRKYGVSLTLMTQHPSRLDAIEDEIENDCKTIVSFRLKGRKDKRAMGDLMACDRDRLMELGNYRAEIQMEFDGGTQGPFKTNMLAPAAPTMNKEDRDALSEKSKREYGVRRADLDGVSTLRRGTEAETDGGEQEPILGEFLRAAAEASSDGVLVEDQHYTFVRKGTPREEFRLNPHRTVEVLDDFTDDLDDVLAQANELVEVDSSYITATGQNSPPVDRCMGVDLGRLSGVDRGAF